MANPGHVPGGDLKGVMNDSNVSDDAEERAEHRLDTAFKSQQPSHTKAPENVTRGSKASLHVEPERFRGQEA